MWPKINWISLPEFHRFSLERQTWDQLLLQYQNEVLPEETPRWDPRTGKEQLAVFLLGGIWFEFISNPFVQTEWWICSHISVNFKVSICFPWWKGGQKWKPKCHCFQTQNRTASRLCFWLSFTIHREMGTWPPLHLFPWNWANIAPQETLVSEYMAFEL